MRSLRNLREKKGPDRANMCSVLAQTADRGTVGDPRLLRGTLKSKAGKE